MSKEIQFTTVEDFDRLAMILEMEGLDSDNIVVRLSQEQYQKLKCHLEPTHEPSLTAVCGIKVEIDNYKDNTPKTDIRKDIDFMRQASAQLPSFPRFVPWVEVEVHAEGGSGSDVKKPVTYPTREE